MTMTFPVLEAARATVVGVFGENKADALRAIRDGSSDLPAARITGEHVEWIVDAAAAGGESAG
jgi:6-phosphogluconolactonase/glucosamine-6-phosphate isomerase/deaminase